MRRLKDRIAALEGRGPNAFTRIRKLVVEAGQDVEEVKRLAFSDDPLLETDLLVIFRCVAPEDRHAA